MPNYTLHYFNGRGRAEILRMMFNAAGQKFNDRRIEFNEWEKCRNDMPCMRVPVLEMDGGMKMPETMAIARYLAREYKFYPTSSMDMMRCDYIADCFYEIMHDYMRYFHDKNGRFRIGSNGEMMMSSNMGSNMSSNMGNNMSSNMGNMSSNMGNMSSNMGKMSSNMGNMPSNMGNMSSNMGNMSSDMGNNMSSNMSSNMGNNMMSSNMGNNSGDMMNCNNYMQWRYMNTMNRIMPFMERTLSMRDGGSKFFMGDQMMMCDMMMYCCMENMMMENKSMCNQYPKMMSLYQRVSSHPKISQYLKSRRNTPW